MHRYGKLSQSDPLSQKYEEANIEQLGHLVVVALEGYGWPEKAEIIEGAEKSK